MLHVKQVVSRAEEKTSLGFKPQTANTMNGGISKFNHKMKGVSWLITSIQTMVVTLYQGFQFQLRPFHQIAKLSYF
ncbi:MAG: hypothetical protein JKY46_01150 [Robiginitomaculum sp.]|nr:hypothetical protein [Robiginitomaculum sp.]